MPRKQRKNKRKGGRKWRKHVGKALSSLTDAGVTYLRAKLGLNTETHWIDTIQSNVATTNTALSMSYPFLIPVGDSANQRNGSQVRATSYIVSGRIQANTAATAGCLVRIIFVRFNDVRGRGSALDGTDFLDDPTRITSMYNMGDTADAFGYSILYDRMYSISVSGQDGDTHRFKFSYSPMNWHLKWLTSNTDGAQGDLQSDIVKGFIYTSETGANTPNFWADHRVKFVDN